MNTSDLSIVIQGMISENGNTTQLIHSIRQNFPDSFIIVSTWDQCSTNDLHPDMLIINKMPEAIVIDPEKNPYKTNNLARQIISTRAGLSQVKTKFALKIRTDSRIFGNGLLNHLGVDLRRDTLGIGLKQRILIGRYCTCSYVLSGKLLHFSDIWMAGDTSDLQRIWNIDPPDEPDFTNYFKITTRSKINKLGFPHQWIRCAPEQLIWGKLCSKPYKDEVFIEGADDFKFSWLRKHIILANDYLHILSNSDSGVLLPSHLENKENCHITMNAINRTPHCMSKKQLALLQLSSWLVRKSKIKRLKYHYLRKLESIGILV